MRIRTLAALALASGLAACGGRAGPDLTPGGTFDPVHDRDRSAYCTAVHYGVGSIGYEVLGLDETAMRGPDRMTAERVARLQKFTDVIQRGDEGTDRHFLRDAVRHGRQLEGDYRTAALVPGSGDRLLKQLLDRSAACDALVRSWGQPPA